MSLFLSGFYKTLEQHIIVYNPLAWNITTVINMTVSFPAAAVFDDDGKPVSAQVGCCLLSSLVWHNYDLMKSCRSSFS